MHNSLSVDFTCPWIGQGKVTDDTDAVPENGYAQGLQSVESCQAVSRTLVESPHGFTLLMKSKARCALDPDATADIIPQNTYDTTQV